MPSVSMNRVVPVGNRVLIRKDDDKEKTEGGIILPNDMKIPTITGRVVEISDAVAGDDDYPIQKFDKVLWNPCHAIPVDLERKNRLFVVPVHDVVAILKRGENDEETDGQTAGRD